MKIESNKHYPHEYDPEEEKSPPFSMKKPKKKKDTSTPDMIPLEPRFEVMQNLEFKKPSLDFKQKRHYDFFSSPDEAIISYFPQLDSITLLKEKEPSLADRYVFPFELEKHLTYEVFSKSSSIPYLLEVLTCDKGHIFIGNFDSSLLSYDGWALYSYRDLKKITQSLGNTPSLKQWIILQNYLYVLLKIKYPLSVVIAYFCKKNNLSLTDELVLHDIEKDLEGVIKTDHLSQKIVIDRALAKQEWCDLPILITAKNILAKKEAWFFFTSLYKQKDAIEGIMVFPFLEKKETEKNAMRKFHLKKEPQKPLLFYYYSEQQAIDIRQISTYLVMSQREVPLEKDLMLFRQKLPLHFNYQSLSKFLEVK